MFPLNSLVSPHFTNPPYFRLKMSASSSSPSISPPPQDSIVVGCGSVAVDYLAAVASYPKPDDKIRSTSFRVQGGGNAGNALTCTARLGLEPRLVSKVADDAQGKGILKELEDDGVDTSFFVVAQEGNSPFTYIIVDNERKTRTCIHTPGYPPMVPEELPHSRVESVLDGARLVYFDVRLHETALVISEEATCRGIPVLVDAEKKREGLDELLSVASYVVCSTKFPQIVYASHFTDMDGRIICFKGLLSMLLRLPKLKFVNVTLGEDGCIMLERCLNEPTASVGMNIEDLLESLKQKISYDSTTPSCILSSVINLRADGIGTLYGRLHVGTAERIPPSELVDTTGAGDAFTGAVLYALCADMPPERMLPFAAQVAACGCRSLGAHSGLPHRSDPRVAPYLSDGSKIATSVL